ncbi:MAG: oligosaccharide flippase family protein [Chloroflexi bacterium]|nr:oligosaccharide flippase family protein [Chloroflexota bacterium]
MTDTLSTTEIKKRSIKGAKWLLVMNGIGMPAASLIALMLGRVGPVALGVYALAQILIGVITTFVIYGGASVLSVFMPKLADAEDRGRFLFSYVLIMFVIMMAALGMFWLFPRGFEFLLQREFDMRNYGWFVLLAIVVVATETLANIASGLMLIKTAAIARQMMRLVLLPLVAILFFFKREILVDYGLPCILGGFVIGYVFAAIICVISISREQRFRIRFGWLLPPGFWAFSFTIMMSTIFSFLYANIDRIAILSIQDLEGLGMYQAVLSVNVLIEKIPLLIRPSIIPTFSNLLATNHRAAFDQAFSLLSRWAVVPVTLVSLGMMAFSQEILGIFGPEYVEYAYLLTLFGLVGIIRSLNLSTNVFTICMEKNAFGLIQQFLNISSQGVLTLVFMSRYDVIAIAGAKMISVAVASFAGVLYVFFGLGVAKKIPTSYKSAVLTGIVMTILRIWVVPGEWLFAVLLFLSSAAIFLILSRFGWYEIRRMIEFFVTRDAKTVEKSNQKCTDELE